MKVYVVVSVSHTLRLFSIEGVFSTEERMQEFIEIAVTKNPGLEFYSGEKDIDVTRHDDSVSWKIG